MTQAYNQRALQRQAANKTRELAITPFEDMPIRHIWLDGEWWYSMVDVAGCLAKSDNPRVYWSKMKRTLLYEEELDVYTLGIRIVKLPDTLGRMQLTDVANTEQVLRLVQSIRSPKAEPFKRWLARIGAIALDDVEEHERRIAYRPQLWEYECEELEVAASHGVQELEEVEALKDANYEGLYGMGEMALLRRRPGHLPGALPDTMGSAELAMNAFQRAMTAELIAKQDAQGIEQTSEVARGVGQEIRTSVERMGGTPPEEMPQYRLLRPGEWMPDNHPSRIQWDEE